MSRFIPTYGNVDKSLEAIPVAFFTPGNDLNLVSSKEDLMNDERLVIIMANYIISKKDSVETIKELMKEDRVIAVIAQSYEEIKKLDIILKNFMNQNFATKCEDCDYENDDDDENGREYDEFYNATRTIH